MIGVEPFPDGHEDTKRIDKRIITTPVSSMVFSGLKGETDGLYLIRAYLEIDTATGGTYGNTPVIQFNADAGASYVWARQDDNGGDRGSSSVGVMLGVSGLGLSSKWFIPSIYIEAKKGKYRHVKSSGSFIDSNGVMHDMSGSGIWTNTTSEVTSLTLKDINSRNLVGGWAKLYKVI